jgi:hypothetical protein
MLSTPQPLVLPLRLYKLSVDQSRKIDFAKHRDITTKLQFLTHRDSSSTACIHTCGVLLEFQISEGAAGHGHWISPETWM